MKSKKTMILFWAFLIFGLVVSLLSLSIGRYSHITVGESLKILIDYLFNDNAIDKSSVSYNVVINLRLPRTLGALFVGASLACAGTAFQALFANPIASPDTLGVTHAASFGAVFAILLGFEALMIKTFAFAIGCIVVMIVYTFASKINKGDSLTYNLLLIGMVVSSVFQSLVSIVKFVADPDNQLAQITYWLMGSFNQFTQSDVKSVVAFFFVGAVPLFVLRWRFNILTLSDSEAYSMGVNIKVLRAITIICATLLTAVSTSLTGGITWFGLIVPHISRMIVGNDFRKILPVSISMGAAFLAVMDIIARSVSMQEIPISILTSLFGAPIFVFVLIKNKRFTR